jgi:8-oxo-dGTP pyrophosphatase MutT (NUDIX family)
MTTTQHITQAIADYSLRFPSEASELQTKTAFLKELGDPCSRQSIAGHVTGSGILIQNGRILLIEHRYIKEWFQPGGHIDPGETPLQAAIRELEEETGWKSHPSNFGGPIDIDVHVIPANPIKNEAEHFHVDFAYLLIPETQTVATDPEKAGWFDISTITAPRLRRVVDKYLDFSK